MKEILHGFSWMRLLFDKRRDCSYNFEKSKPYPSYFVITFVKNKAMRTWVSLKTYTDIKFEFFEGIAKITINRPQVYNAFRPETNMEILDALHICRERNNISVVVLTGAGDKAFCSGGDQNVKGIGGYISENGVPRLNVLDIHKAIRSLPKPVIAMVNGYAIGGGHVLHVVCDLTIASENARFGQTGPKVGSFDGGFGSSYLARHVGQKKAREIWYLNKRYSGQEAVDMGLANICVPHDQLDATVQEWGETICERSPTAIAIAKRSFNMDTAHQSGIAGMGMYALKLYYDTEESREGVNALKEKRKPDFRKYAK